jgi:hypothetical protein
MARAPGDGALWAAGVAVAGLVVTCFVGVAIGAVATAKVSSGVAVPGAAVPQAVQKVKKSDKTRIMMSAGFVIRLIDPSSQRTTSH